MELDASELKKITAAVADVANGKRERVAWRGDHKQLGSLVRAINRALGTRSALQSVGPRPVVWSDPMCTHKVENGELHESCLTAESERSNTRLRK